jgi:hypothetical protein
MSDNVSIASAASVMDGTVGVDHVWLRRLQRALDETECPASLDDALRPLWTSFPDEIDAGDLQAAVDGQRELWRDLLYSAAGGFDLHQSYLLDWAVAIYVYTLGDPKVFRVVNREMFNSDRCKPGMTGGVSDGLRACLPYICFLINALEALPASYVFKGTVLRGVKHVYPSPDNHDPVGHFSVGKRLAWYEFKSTSKEPEVMTREHFCDVKAGPRTKFSIDVIHGYDISKFSFFQGNESEYEVLLLPMSQFVVVHAEKNIIDPKDTVSLQRSGFPDSVHLRQVEARHAPATAGGQEAQEQEDVALARALRQSEETFLEERERERERLQRPQLDLDAPVPQHHGHHGTAYATTQQPQAPPMSGQQIPDTGRGLQQPIKPQPITPLRPAPAPHHARTAPAPQHGTDYGYPTTPCAHLGVERQEVVHAMQQPKAPAPRPPIGQQIPGDWRWHKISKVNLMVFLFSAHVLGH